jgi:hypothetical protein
VAIQPPIRQRPSWAKGRADYDVYYQDEIDGWEQTDHFQIMYGQPLREIGWKDAYAQGFDETRHDEPSLVFIYDFYLPMKDEFWERWAQVHKLHEFWQQLVARDLRQRP